MEREMFFEDIKRAKILLPPLSGYTDYPFRCILSTFNPPNVCTEMVNARAVIQQNHKTMNMLRKESGHHYRGVQLIGNKSMEMRNAALILEERGFDYIDINMGCTVQKVVSKGQGIALMNHESVAIDIIEKVVTSVDIPVTVKVRTGVSDKNRNVVSLSKKFEQAGVSLITVHGRTGERKFGMPVDYNTIKRVVDAVDIPVVANGGVTMKTAASILEKTDAIAVMPGRNLIGNPWLIDHVRNGIDHTDNPPALSEKKEMVKKHLYLQCMFYGEYNGIQQFRTILPKYFRHCHYANRLKDDVKQMRTCSDALDIIRSISSDGTNCLYK